MATATATVLKQISERPLVKNKQNPHFKNRYADLDACQDAVLPVLYEHGWFIQTTTLVKNFGEQTFIVLSMTLVDEDGTPRMSAEYPVAPIDEKPQSIGSAMTYARRYCLCAMFNLTADEDDDGNAANGAPAAPTETRKAPTAGASARPGLRRLS